MWTFEKIDREITAGVPLIYLNDGRWWAAYQPTENHGVIYSCGMKERSSAVYWGALRVAEWTKYLNERSDIETQLQQGEGK